LSEPVRGNPVWCHAHVIARVVGVAEIQTFSAEASFVGNLIDDLPIAINLAFHFAELP
jgi:hypothetical protein